MSYSRLFADLSSNNAQFIAHEYRQAGHILVAIKATEGTRYVNPDHRPWSYAAGSQHIAVAHYHFARPDLNDNPEAEAWHFLNVAHPLTGGRDYLVLDYERSVPAGWKHDPAWSARFALYVSDHSRFQVILYANRSTLEESDQWLGKQTKKRVWDADYSVTPDYAPPGYTCAMRQFTDGVVGPGPHELPGVGRGDVNRMSLSMFEAVASKAR